MMRNIALVLVFGFCSNILLCQFVYESGDFVKIGDEVIYSTALNLDPSVNFQLAGEDVEWDYSGLTSVNVDTVTYFDPNDAGYRFSYCLANAFIFNCQTNFDALTNLAELSVDSFAVGDFRSANITRHYHLSDGEFAETMLGVTAQLEGIDVPVAIDFEERDVVLKFPLVFGNVDSSESRFVLDLTAVGVDAGFARSRKRVNKVEGYGRLVTPAGSYDEVLKVKTMIYNVDTTALDSLSIPINSVEIEYKWYASGVAGHVMKANGTVIAGTELIAQMEYRGVETTVSVLDSSFEGIAVYPNPFTEELQVRSSEVEFESYQLLNHLGQQVLYDEVNASQITIHANLASGSYFLVLKDKEASTWVRKVVRI